MTDKDMSLTEYVRSLRTARAVAHAEAEKQEKLAELGRMVVEILRAYVEPTPPSTLASEGEWTLYQEESRDLQEGIAMDIQNAALKLGLFGSEGGAPHV